ncbi:hypothetical protein IV38_GL000513 [Lactobacillus selangorensis]|uniref:RNA-binding protein KhpA n=2 Tax=Lactobacillus selangorensis TaxID=81857 RepID=A0A0R2FWG9_9LACO|nr:hypothetical protein IV38_GL000513 [Lactobacillus selangorensis]
MALVQPLVRHPEAVKITQSESDRFIEFNLHVAKDDIGRIIGKQGHVAQSIRTIVYGVKTGLKKRVRLNIVDA